ncbi:hypothetical protein [Photobacterium minamisatsumaniensis]|uniref:hypothetical protein n=1 Tax=Photobacterium minamisatsumaniensis TaxID=2910233 RepID=UPI003D1176FD
MLLFDKKGGSNGELADLLKLCLALTIEGLDNVVKSLKADVISHGNDSLRTDVMVFQRCIIAEQSQHTSVHIGVSRTVLFIYAHSELNFCYVSFFSNEV